LETVGLSVPILKRNVVKVPDHMGPTAVDRQQFFLPDPKSLSIYPHFHVRTDTVRVFLNMFSSEC